MNDKDNQKETNSVNDKLQVFENRPIRTVWDNEREEWYFFIVDTVGALTEQPDARHASTYWAVIKKRLASEGASQLLTNCKQLKLKATDGKKYLTDVATTEGGKITGDARQTIESQTGRPVVTSKTAAELGFIVSNFIEGTSNDALDQPGT